MDKQKLWDAAVAHNGLDVMGWDKAPMITIENPDELESLMTAIQSAAAPQVVADERALPFLPKPAAIKHPTDDTMGCVLFSSQQMQDYARATLAAAPVQAQEPVAWRYEWASCITCDGPQNFKLTFDVEPPPEWAVQDGQARNVVKLFGTPVHPVAVPDGLAKLKAAYTCKTNGGQVRKAVWLDEVQSLFAAPTAQGDKK